MPATTGYLAEVLLAALSSELVLFQRRELGLGAEQSGARLERARARARAGSVRGGARFGAQRSSSASTSLPTFSPANSFSSDSLNASTPPCTMCSRETICPSRIQPASSAIASP